MQTRGSVREETVYERLSKQTSDGCIVSLSSHSGAAVKLDSCLSHIYRYRKKLYTASVKKKQCKYIFIYIYMYVIYMSDVSNKHGVCQNHALRLTAAAVNFCTDPERKTPQSVFTETA